MVGLPATREIAVALLSGVVSSLCATKGGGMVDSDPALVTLPCAAVTFVHLRFHLQRPSCPSRIPSGRQGCRPFAPGLGACAQLPRPGASAIENSCRLMAGGRTANLSPISDPQHR